MGACFGFLWWNTAPAKIFMGITGSLALGGALAGLAITTRTEHLSVILAGLFLIEVLSVMIQVGFFKTTRQRVFRMALHHHFEMVGWQEITVTVRFWIIAGLFVALGLGIFYAEWVVGTSLSIPPEDSTPSMPQDPSPAPAVDPRPGLTHGGADWAGLRVTVVGLGLSGFAAADALLERGARVYIVSPDATGIIAERGTILEILGARILLGDPNGVGESALSAVTGAEFGHRLPGRAAHRPAYARRGRGRHPVWGEVELAWRMRPAEGAAPWLTVTGTNGKTTTVKMLASILSAAGLRAVAAGNVGTPSCRGRAPPAALRCHRRRGCRAPGALVAHHRSSRFGLSQCRSGPHRLARLVCRVPRRQGEGLRQHPPGLHLQRRRPADRAELVRDADVVEGCRAVGFTLGIPALSMLRWSTTSSPTGPSSSSGRTRPPSWARWPTCAARAPAWPRTMSPTPSPPPPWPAPTGGGSARRPGRPALVPPRRPPDR